MREMLFRAARGSHLETDLDQVGNPFRHLLHIELRMLVGHEEAETRSHAIFNEAKRITNEEAVTGLRAAACRDRLLNAIRNDTLASYA
jgi:hypothetical protein